jgi:hypothetical protein
LASQVFNKALSIFVHSFSSGTPLSSSPLWHEDRGGVLVLVVTWPLPLLMPSPVCSLAS